MHQRKLCTELSIELHRALVVGRLAPTPRNSLRRALALRSKMSTEEEVEKQVDVVANTGPRDMPPTEHLSGALVLNSGCSIAVDTISARRRDVPAGSPELSASMFPTTAQQSWDWRRYASEFTPFLDRWVQGVAAVRHAHYCGQWRLFLLRGECYVPDPILDDMWVPPNARTPTGPAIQYADI